MSNQFLKLRRSAVPGRIPTTSSLDFGEIALNTYDGLAFMKKSGSSGEEIVTLGTGTGTFGSFTVYSLPTASYDTAFFEYSIKSGSNARAGTIMAIQAGSSVNFTETTTTDIGNTTAVSFTVLVSGSNLALTGSSATGSWTIKSIVRGI